MSDWVVEERLLTEKIVADHYGRDTRTLVNWDNSPRMAALGWPQPVKINGRRYRNAAELARFDANLKAQGGATNEGAS